VIGRQDAALIQSPVASFVRTPSPPSLLSSQVLEQPAFIGPFAMVL
jgi:hypothetical protein